MKAHPLAEIFPLLEGAPFDGLVADIKAHGQRDPIVIYNGRILDGRNRWRACKAAGADPKTREFRGTDAEALAFVVSTNLHRRHLDESQRAACAARAATLQQGVPVREAVAKAAEAFNVSERSVFTAKKVIETATPEVVRAVEQGVVPVSHAVQLAARPAEEQRAVIARVEAGESKNAKQAERAVEQEKRKALPARGGEDGAPRITFKRGDARELAAKIKEPVHCLCTDPPYGSENHNTRRGGKDYEDGGVRLSREVVAAVVPHLAPDAHIYMFAGYDGVREFMAMLGEFFEVQPNPLIWIKDNHTMCDFAQWYPNRHEYVIFAKQKGSKRRLAACVPDTIPCARSRVTTHSAEKPVQLLETLIQQSTVPGELVLDPFMGGGSTGVAARHLSRAFLGFELEQDWYDVARSRQD